MPWPSAFAPCSVVFLAGTYAVKGDPWKIIGAPEPDVTSSANPRGIKIGGGHPQNNRELNACNCRLDGLLLDRAVTADEVRGQYEWVTKGRR